MNIPPYMGVYFSTPPDMVYADKLWDLNYGIIIKVIIFYPQ